MSYSRLCKGSAPPGEDELLWMLVSAAPLLSSDGNIERLICTYHEITELKRAEKALRQSQERLRESEATLNAFFEASPGILNVIDEDGFRYVKTDSITPTYFDLTRETIIGKSLHDLAPEFIARFGPMMKEIIETGVPRLGQEVFQPVPSRPGMVTTWRSSYFPVPLAGGRRGIGIMGVEITDITKAQEEQQRLLKALGQANEEHDEHRVHHSAGGRGTPIPDARVGPASDIMGPGFGGGTAVARG